MNTCTGHTNPSTCIAPSKALRHGSHSFTCNKHHTEKVGYDEKFVRLLESLYNGTMSTVRVGGGLTEWFATIIGVMQGCILSPLLFNILLEVVMALALNRWEFGIKVSGTCLSNLRFADDISLLANSEGELQQLVDRVHVTSNIDNVKEDCNRLELTLTEAARAAQDQHQWRSIVHNLGCQRARTTSSSPRH